MGSISNSPNSLELGLSLKPSYVPKTISDLLSDLAKIDNIREKLSVLNDYLKKYEEELSWVVPFRRELPQCVLLLMEAIEIMKGEITKLTKNNGGEESEFDGQRRFNEFLKRKRSIYDNEEMNISPPWSAYQENRTDHKETANLSPESQKIPRIESNSFGTRLKANQSCALEIRQQDPFSDPTWKISTRRHWTDELHAKFKLALSILGGPKAATPKQIREVMCVKGLTTDQIKSHLQKFRLHMKADGGSKNQMNGEDHNPAVGAPYDQSNNHTGIWVPRAQVMHLYAPNMAQAQTSTAINDQQNDVVTTNDINSDDGNFAGWLNHISLCGTQF
ncbi:Myb family transcription factor APL [Morus notabilis]|uniref:Myb family transcription factor APL n=1 Tax=Morus notabilis TaxID=981085 RepID=W9RK58_9ROSA|nr:Myb family transcription factor APL [Morus notabilis]